MDIASSVQYETWGAGQVPPVERVRDGLWSIPVPMPKSSLRYTLAYAFESPGGVSIVDAGWNADVSWDGLVDGLAAAGFKPGHVRALIATHAHTDHYGLADRIRQASGARISLHRADAATFGGGDGPARDVAAARRELGRRIGAPSAPAGAAGAAGKRRPGRDRRDGGTRLDHTAGLDDTAGLDNTVRPDNTVRSDNPDNTVRSDNTAGQARRYNAQTWPDVLIEDGDLVDLPGWNLRAIWTPGHSPGHVCYYEQDLGVLLAGDHVLPRITPNISVSTSQRANPLGDYLASLTAIGDLPVTEVLPAHQYRFHGLRQRVDELAAHHEARLAQIEDVIGGSQGVNCWEITGRLEWSRPFASLPSRLQRAAARETLAHLVLLQLRGRLRGDGGQPERWY